MKTTDKTSIVQMNEAQLKELVSTVEERLATKATVQTPSPKTKFSVAELWNLQKRRNRGLRRNYIHQF